VVARPRVDEWFFIARNAWVSRLPAATDATAIRTTAQTARPDVVCVTIVVAVATWLWCIGPGGGSGIANAAVVEQVNAATVVVKTPMMRVMRVTMISFVEVVVSTKLDPATRPSQR
jgi:hypothetical protein